MKKLLVSFFIGTLLMFNSCEYLEDWLEDPANEITSDEVVEALKVALEIGADSATSILSLTDGYYMGHPLLVRIPLPQEAENVRAKIIDNNLANILNLDAQFEKVILSVNRAAEHAANDVFPIFKNAIANMSVEEGWDILNGIIPGGEKAAGFDSTAATGYFRLKTYDNLVAVYKPYINESLSRDLGLGFSANDAWNTLVTMYNNLMSDPIIRAAISTAEFLAGKDFNLPAFIETDLSLFSTQRALNGLFYKVGNEEMKIRHDPYKWGEELIEKVFGWIQDNYDPEDVSGSM